MPKTLSIGQLLTKTDSGLSRVIKRSKALRKLTSHLKSFVDAPLNEHIYVANIRDTTLVIGTDSAAWHTRVKYLAPMILEQMRQLPDMERLQKVEFRVQPFSSVSQNTNLRNSKTSNLNQAERDNIDKTHINQRLEKLSQKFRGKN
ncbi:DciA family protein [Kaarinaea lacus]